MWHKHSRLTWQDMYYDGQIDPEYELFDEDAQVIIDNSKVKFISSEEIAKSDAYTTESGLVKYHS